MIESRFGARIEGHSAVTWRLIYRRSKLHRSDKERDRHPACERTPTGRDRGSRMQRRNI